MYLVAILVCLLALTANPATAQTASSIATDEITLQNSSGKPAAPPSRGRVASQDSAQVDTTSPRARRMRAARQPRPGIFTSLDSAKTKPDSVIFLSIRGKGLTSLPGLAQFKNLQALDAAGNNLSSFPTEVLKLAKLVSLDLSDNPIKSVPAEIGGMTSLSRLSLRNTSITTLPASVGSLVSLSSLDVSKNPLTSLPIKELNQLPRLKSISLGQLPQQDNAQPSVPDTTPDAKTSPQGNK